jgi:hypothetical protein
MDLNRLRDVSPKGWLVIGGGLLLLGGLLCGGYVGLGNFEYSDGHRDGYVQKMSKKGVVWKTWEGELAMPGFGSGSGKKTGQSDGGNTWAFSVENDEVAQELDKLQASQFVRLYYKERLWALPWRGSTGYFVYKVEKLEGDAKLPAANP